MYLKWYWCGSQLFQSKIDWQIYWGVLRCTILLKIYISNDQRMLMISHLKFMCFYNIFESNRRSFNWKKSCVGSLQERFVLFHVTIIGSFFKTTITFEAQVQWTDEHEIFNEHVKLFGNQISYFSKIKKIILYLKIIFVNLLH